ncbi:hypothetical protein [Lysinibacillus irui]|uniref:Restriction system protein Mrr-like N-terminal domain-containing protein n=1 Tax=Lysinibacillus irui TaxID=2998077 RepID=A0AAJ5UT89_9BACI|nr:hypothetical protein [Lysinibacillus irui]WDV06733.1 hypothetical protein OU989_21315 [Lysinibacillus irui]
MLYKKDLQKLVVEALEKNNGSASIVLVAKYIWVNYQKELECSGDLFYTWQYDIRWAKEELIKHGIIKTTKLSKRGIWELK